MFGNFEEAPQNGGANVRAALLSVTVTVTDTIRVPWPGSHAALATAACQPSPLPQKTSAPFPVRPPPGPLLAHAAQPWPGVELTDRFPSKPSTAHRFRCRNGRALS